ncbi:MAG: nucleoside-triphosphatase, partial [Candidatus Methanofastidiosia archaeon]
PRIGKTTLIQKVVKNFDSVSGFYTKEILRGGRRIGFKIQDFRGRKGILAHLDHKSKYRVSKYGVNLKDLEEIISGIDLSKDLIVIDEIGKMELFSLRFREFVLKALETRKVLGTILLRANPFCDEIRKRRDTEIIEVTFQNREKLVFEVREKLKR